jgi:hypothetical protein
MTTKTLKQLIEIEFERCETISQFKSEVLRLIDLYQQDKPFIPTPGFTIQPEMVMYCEICSCNPKNGGNGICGCTIGNQMVPKQNTTYGHNWSTSTGSEL